MYHILFGFDDEDIVKAIVRTVKKQTKQTEVQYSTQTTKDAIEEYIHYQPNIDTIILREVMDGDSWSAEELAELNDKKNYNIIVVIDKKHKGTDYCTTLYTAGITSAILVENGDFVTPGQITHFIINPRNRATARKEYGMDSIKVPVNFLTSDMYLKKYAFLMDESQGAGLIDRYLIIVRDLTVKNAVSFTEKLPSNVRNRLMEYEEFWTIQDHFKSCGLEIALKKPKHLRRGLSPEAFKEIMKKQKKVKLAVPREYIPIRDTTPVEETPVPGTSNDEQNDYFNEMIDLFDDTIPSKSNSTEAKKAVETGSVVEPVVHTMAQNNTAPGKPQVVQQNRIPSQVKPVSSKSVTSKKPIKVKQTNVTSKKKKEAEAKVKTRINWKLVIGMFIASILMLVIFYFVLQMM